MKNPEERIKGLESELERVRAKLENSKEHERELEGTRKTMLYLLEDLNETTAKVLRAKKEWEGTFDAIKDPIFIHDRHLRLVRVNRTYKEAVDLPYKDIIGRNYYEVFPRMEKPFAVCLKGLEKEEEEGQEEFFLSEVGKTFSTRSYPIRDEEGRFRYSIHVMEDITETKKAEKELKRSFEKIWEEKEINSNLLMVSDATAWITDLDRLLEEVLGCAHRVVGCDMCLSYLWEEDSKVFKPAQSYGLGHEMVPFFRTEPLDERAPFVKEATKGSGVVIYTEPDGSLTGTALKWVDNINMMFVIPLTGRVGYLGLIVGIFCRVSCPVFRDREKQIIKGISQQVSVALEEARFYKESMDRTMELSRKIETIKVMHEIDRAILSTLEPQEILETAVRMVAKLVSCERATVTLVDREGKGFIYAAGFGLPFMPKGTFVKFSDTSATDVVKTGRPQYASDLTKTGELRALENRLVKEGFISHMRVPIVQKGQIAGVLSVGSRRHSSFSPEDLSTVEKLAGQVALALENSRLVTDLEELFIGTVRSLSGAIDAKSEWTAGHSKMVTETSLAIGKVMGLDEEALKRLELTGLLHDTGKIGTYEGILDKPGKLSPEELTIMRKHPEKGAEIVEPIKPLKDIIPAIRHHHEHYDGAGYPDGLKGTDIPLFSRIITVADTVDAMGSDRPYRKGLPMEVIIEELKRCSRTQFDPAVVDAFLKTLKIQPGRAMRV
jgi:putative nucleotidyltransferase with HDIG domain/PAS domain S-box-containing protein